MPDTAAVADTNALLFHSAQSRRLGLQAKQLLDAADRGAAVVYVPIAVVWETIVLARAGRISLPASGREFFTNLFSNPAYQPHDLTAEQVYAAEDLPFNRDPFDGLIVAAAQLLELPLLTRDTEIAESGAVRVIW